MPPKSSAGTSCLVLRAKLDKPDFDATIDPVGTPGRVFLLEGIMKADAVLEKIRTEITKQLGPDKVGPITVTFDEKEWGLLLAEIAYLRSTQETYIRLKFVPAKYKGN